MRKLSICSAECSFEDNDPNPFNEIVSFYLVLRVRAIAAKRDIPKIENRFLKRAKALVESMKKGGAK